MRCKTRAHEEYKKRAAAGKIAPFDQASTPKQTSLRQIQYVCQHCDVAFWAYPRSGSPRSYCSRQCACDGVGVKRRSALIAEIRENPQQCRRCKVWYPLEQYPLTKNARPARSCRDCLQNTTPEMKRISHLRVKFGISLEAWIALYDSQAGKCAICQDALPSLEIILATPERRTGKRVNLGWSTDHCHATGKVRGILCRACNHALGNLKDAPARALAAAAYLKKHSVCDHAQCSSGPAGRCYQRQPASTRSVLLTSST